VIDSKGKGCSVFVSGISEHYRKIFEITGLTRYTTVVESEDDITEESERAGDT
jgi:anti-anti-sigma regulatory factor